LSDLSVIPCLIFQLLYMVSLANKMTIHRQKNGARGGAIIRKVVGSIPDAVIGSFHSRNPSVLTMTPESTQTVRAP